MMNNGLRLIAALALMSLTACAHTVEEQDFSLQPEPIIEEQFPDADELARMAESRRQREQAAKQHSEIQENIVSKTSRFQMLVKEQDCRGAERVARRLWESYSSRNNELESDMLTAICLCHLQVDGDIDRFTRCSEELADMSSQLRFLDRETQVVLELQPYFSQNQTAGRDPRIDSFITRGVKNTFGTTN